MVTVSTASEKKRMTIPTNASPTPTATFLFLDIDSSSTTPTALSRTLSYKGFIEHSIAFCNSLVDMVGFEQARGLRLSSLDRGLLGGAHLVSNLSDLAH